MATPETDFDGLASGGQPPPGAYTGLTAVANATTGGSDYQQNRRDISKPWTLPIYRPPDVRPIG